MMHVRITTPECPTSTRQQIARELTDTIAEALDLRPENRRRISIQFEPIQQSCLALGGELVTNGKSKRNTLCLLDVCAPQLSMQTKRHLIEQMSRACARSLEVEISSVVVTFQEYQPENVGVGGELMAQYA